MTFEEINLEDRKSLKRWVNEELGIQVFCRTKQLADALHVSTWTINNDIRKGLLKPRFKAQNNGYFTFSVDNIISYLQRCPERLKMPKTFSIRYSPDFDQKIDRVIGTQFYNFARWYGKEDLKQDVILRMSRKAVSANNEWIAIVRTCSRIYQENKERYENRPAELINQ